MISRWEKYRYTHTLRATTDGDRSISVSVSTCSQLLGDLIRSTDSNIKALTLISLALPPCLSLLLKCMNLILCNKDISKPSVSAQSGCV